MYHKQANLSAIQANQSAFQACPHFLHLIPVLELSLTVYFPFEIQVSQNSKLNFQINTNYSKYMYHKKSTKN